MELVIAGIPVEVCKKRIKNMHLYVKPPGGFVTVSAPVGMSDDAIERFARANIGWIRRQVGKFDDQPRQSEREYVSGEALYVWGKRYLLLVDYGDRNSIVLSGNRAVLTVREASSVASRDKFVREWYRGLLRAEASRLIPKWEGITGLECSGWQTRYMVTHWGTCNVKTGKIWLNLQLAKKTPECLEYVILHELLHLVEKNHTEGFILLMDRYMPLWREVRGTLNGQILDYMG